jgi:hypothetical protein
MDSVVTAASYFIVVDNAASFFCKSLFCCYGVIVEA